MFMVSIDKFNNKEYYQCEECAHYYELREMAQGCEKWCRTHKSSNPQILAESIENKKEGI